MRAQSVLISGAGIAGPTLAFWLNTAGFETTIVERAPELRSGGYVIDFWGIGYDIAERMGLAGELETIGYHIRELRIVGDHGERLAGFGVSGLRSLAGGRFITIPRSGLSRLLYDKAAPHTEVIFGDQIAAVREEGNETHVEFEHSPARRFDLVFGADGLHSNVRKLVFGPEHRFERDLGYAIAAFEAEGYRPRDSDVYVLHNEPGAMVGRVALRGDRTLFLLIFTSERGAAPQDIDGQKAVLRERYRSGGWECAQILDRLDAASELYFDRVSQIRMERWSKGRIALVGDSAFCVSLAAGQGSALSMTAAHVLAGELGNARGRHEAAFRAYEALLRPYIEVKQKGAERFSTAFAPRTKWGRWARNLIVNTLSVPGLARFIIGRELIDELALPDYQWPADARHQAA
jgi:2-polyprenyl-6-methoxyphenol hydroxylase-like FAD-dependent oxidoreductase